MQPFNTTHKKPPARATIPAEEKFCLSAEERRLSSSRSVSVGSTT
jgi:hypothetical protein